jgi:NADPH:quinone reductase-like Zn-dependent oxidoreductase
MGRCVYTQTCPQSLDLLADGFGCSLLFCYLSQGSTAVGHHAVQLARLSGFRVFVTASPGAHALMRELGADEVFDYRDPNVVDVIKKAAGREGVFAAYDTAGSNLEQCIGESRRADNP